MATYSAIKITKSPATGVTEITQMGATNHDFISVSIDDATDTVRGITSSGTEITYESHATLSIAFVS
jgi:hypothetical protein